MSEVVKEVTKYLKGTEKKFSLGSYEYYARKALGLALQSCKKGNYGVGAILLSVQNGFIKEHHGGNQMMTGKGQWSVIGHAETSALVNFKNGKNPNNEYPKDENAYTNSLPVGETIIGSLEPCPMCAFTMMNAGVRLSISTVLDGRLEKINGVEISNGAAMAIGEKAKYQPFVLQMIQAQLGLKFLLLETKDTDLVNFSRLIFDESRSKIDANLANRKRDH